MKVNKFSDGARVIELTQDEIAELAAGRVIGHGDVTIAADAPKAEPAGSEESDPVGGEGGE
jgi:hypothetical protein